MQFHENMYKQFYKLTLYHLISFALGIHRVPYEHKNGTYRPTVDTRRKTFDNSVCRCDDHDDDYYDCINSLIYSPITP